MLPSRNEMIHFLGVDEMVFKYGEPYRGPGCAEQMKTRQERRMELVQMLKTSDGREIVEYLFLFYLGAFSGKWIRPGSRYIETILDAEYPT